MTQIINLKEMGLEDMTMTELELTEGGNWLQAVAEWAFGWAAQVLTESLYNSLCAWLWDANNGKTTPIPQNLRVYLPAGVAM